MLRMVKVPRLESKVKGFPYQLLEWQPTLGDVMEAAYQFTKYACEDQAVIIQGPKNRWAIFSTGEGIEKDGRGKYASDAME